MTMSDTASDIACALIERLRPARAGSNRAIQGFLHFIKEEHNLSPSQLRVSGNNRDELLEHIRSGVERGHISTGTLKSFVDRLEENGDQHIFLFDLTDKGAAVLTADALAAAFPPLPSLDASMYAETPTKSSVFFEHRSDALVVKQIHTATYWTKSEAQSQERSEEGVRRVTVELAQHRRAINLLRIFPERREAEIRIDRLSHAVKRADIGDHFRGFMAALAPILDAKRHLVSTRIWRVFGRIADESREGTYMRTDTVKDASTSFTMSNRREGDLGSDVRDHPDYSAIHSPDRIRDTLSLRWSTEWLVEDSFDETDRGDPDQVHITLSKFTVDTVDYGKIHIAASVSPEVLFSVTEYIRRFTR